MEAKRPEIRFLHMASKTGNGSVFMESSLAVLSESQLHGLCDSAVRGRREPFTVFKFELVNIIPIQTIKCKIKYIEIFKENVLTQLRQEALRL